MTVSARRNGLTVATAIATAFGRLEQEIVLQIRNLTASL